MGRVEGRLEVAFIGRVQAQSAHSPGCHHQHHIKPSTEVAVSTPSVKAGEPEVQGNLLLHKEVKASLGYMKLCLYKRRKYIHCWTFALRSGV